MHSNMYRLYEKNKNIKINLPKRLRSEGSRNSAHCFWLAGYCCFWCWCYCCCQREPWTSSLHTECERILPLVVPCVVQSLPQGPYFLSSAPHQTHEMCVYRKHIHTHTHIQCRWVLTAFTVPRQKQPQHRVSVLCVIEGYGFEATGIRPYTHSIYAREHANIHTKQRSSTTLRFYRCTALQLCIAAWQSRIVEWI